MQSVNVGERESDWQTDLSSSFRIILLFGASRIDRERERSGRGGAALISTPQPPPQAKAAGMVGDATAASLRLSVVVVAIRQSGSLTPSPSLCQPTSPRALVSGSATMTASAATAATSSRSVSAVPQENEEARREEQPRRSSGAAAVQWQNLHGHRATACKEKN